MYGHLGEIARIALERIIAVLGGLGVRGPSAAQLVDRRIEILSGDAGLRQHPANVGILGERHGKEQALYRDILVAGLGRDLLGLIENADGVAVECRRLRRAAARDRGNLRDQHIDFAAGGLRVPARSLDQARGHALLVVEQGLQEMRRRDALMMFANRDRLGGLQEAPGAVGQFLKIHSLPLFVGPIWCCSTATQA